jgi:hypothetical protein
MIRCRHFRYADASHEIRRHSLTPAAAYFLSLLTSLRRLRHAPFLGDALLRFRFRHFRFAILTPSASCHAPDFAAALLPFSPALFLIF